MSRSPRKISANEPPALIALRRAAHLALELAQSTGTPAYVIHEGKIVDLASREHAAIQATKARTSRRKLG